MNSTLFSLQQNNAPTWGIPSPGSNMTLSAQFSNLTQVIPECTYHQKGPFIASEILIPNNRQYVSIIVPVPFFKDFANELYRKRDEYGDIQEYNIAIQHFIEQITQVFFVLNDDSSAMYTKHFGKSKSLQQLNSGEFITFLESCDFGNVLHGSFKCQNHEGKDPANDRTKLIQELMGTFHAPILNSGIHSYHPPLKTITAGKRELVLDYIVEGADDTEVHKRAYQRFPIDDAYKDENVQKIVDFISGKLDLNAKIPSFVDRQAEVRRNLRYAPFIDEISIAVYSIGDASNDTPTTMHACLVVGSAQETANAVVSLNTFTGGFLGRTFATKSLGLITQLKPVANPSASKSATTPDMFLQMNVNNMNIAHHGHKLVRASYILNKIELEKAGDDNLEETYTLESKGGNPSHSSETHGSSETSATSTNGKGKKIKKGKISEKVPETEPEKKLDTDPVANGKESTNDNGKSSLDNGIF